MHFTDPGHVNGFYLGQFLAQAGWATRKDEPSHPLHGLDPESGSDLDCLAELLLPTLDGLNEAQDAALARTWADMAPASVIASTTRPSRPCMPCASAASSAEMAWTVPAWSRCAWASLAMARVALETSPR